MSCSSSPSPLSLCRRSAHRLPMCATQHARLSRRLPESCAPAKPERKIPRRATGSIGLEGEGNCRLHPAFTTVWKKRGRGDRGGYRYRITTVSSTICPSVLGGRSSLGSIYLSGGERSWREMKKPFPPAQRNGQLSQNDR